MNQINAYSAWEPNKKELKALQSRSYIEDLDSVDQIWPWLAENHGEIKAIQAPHAEKPEEYNYFQIEENISVLASALFTLGIREGDVIAVFAENSPRWLLIDQGLMRIGAANAVRGIAAPPDELRYILNDSNSVALVVQNKDLLRKLNLNEAEKKQLKFIIQLEGLPLDNDILSWEKLITTEIIYDKLNISHRDQKKNYSNKIATILYTSGTTGRPKGVPLTHSNLLHQIRSLACIAHPSPGAAVLSVLPIWHSYERSAEYFFFSCACTQTYTTIKDLKNDIKQVKPYIMATVPRLWEAIKNGFNDALKDMPPLKKKMIKIAMNNSINYKISSRKVRNLSVEFPSKISRFKALLILALRFPAHSLSSVFIYPRIVQQLTGGELRFPINGGGALAPHVDLFFESLGVELLVGYGLTETSPVISCRRPWENIRGSAGPPLPGTKIKIVDPQTHQPKRFLEKGLVMVKGPQVMSGYLRNPDATAKVFDDEGWFNTGDIGYLLPLGGLVLTGRQKDTIVLSSGENIEPGPLEDFVVASPLFDQVMIVGQDEKQ